MAVIEIRPDVEEWLERAVFSEFSKQDVSVSASAKTLIAYVLQSQPRAFPPREIAGEYQKVQYRMQSGGDAAGTFFERSVEVYLRMYPDRDPLNVNRAVRLLTELYFASYGRFPCGPTRGGGSEGGSQGGSQGGSTSGNEPATLTSGES
jgi:hypothetical protein